MMEPSLAPDDHARSVLREVFGYPEFRPGQREAVAAITAGRDTVVLLPTGAGKSLCYQVPALVAGARGQGTTVVISPLIALMQDQVGALRARGVAAAAINSHQDEDDQRAVVGALLRGELQLLYVSPERAALAGFRRLLTRVPVALLAIDEAHCVSQWGHDFRPEYLRLGELRALVRAPVAALTATATPRVMNEIVRHLYLEDPVIVRGDFRRPNLSFSAMHLRSDAQRIAAVIGACEEAGLRSRTGPGRGIVYCSTRKKTESVALELRAAGFPVGYYHAGRTPEQRERIQAAFDLGRLRVLVATNAFGMGVDYPDVRLIVHFQAPGSLAAYYQEAGRAGRDGLPAHCMLLFGVGDLVTQRRLQTSGPAGAARERQVSEALRAVEAYATRVRCRQEMLCAYFTGVEEQRPCGLCDVCTRPDEVASALAAPDERPAGGRASRRPAGGGAARSSSRRGAARAPAPAPASTSPLALELREYRRRAARELEWKAFMVFPDRVIDAIDHARPRTMSALGQVPGLGPAKLERFGRDILAIVERHAAG